MTIRTDSSFTQAQRSAIEVRGNVLVVAGAGTGKTRTLVERCLACLLHETPRVSIDEILMVTFTEAAAAEMRQRIRARLEQESHKGHGLARWHEQLALFETAHIGTLHSFCLQLVRQHFYQLELDPQLAVLDQDESRLLAEETLDNVLQKHYAGRSADSEAVQLLIHAHGRGWDKPIRALVLKLHEYAQSLPDPASWVDSQLGLFAAPQPSAWRQWLTSAIPGFAAQWLPMLESLSSSNTVAVPCAAALRILSHEPAPESIANAFRGIHQAKKECPDGKKKAWLHPLKGFFRDAAFLASLIQAPGAPDPLAEDWGWVCGHMTALLKLAREFSDSFTQAKRELGVLDFQDLEQYALRLLWDHSTRQRTAVAQQWQQKLRFIFVDEYQDINAAQDKIIHALARDNPQGNRFLVGDVKQSIYRFRLANPRIFQSYATQWTGGAGSSISLVENFRSREALLHFINSVFELLAKGPMGVGDYRSEAALRFGAPEERTPLGRGADPTPAVELHLIEKGRPEFVDDNEEGPGGFAEVIELQDAELEARLAAQRLGEMRGQQHLIWDVKTSQFRPVDWQDMAVLLRSPARKAERYAREFSRLKVPLQVARGGFYQSIEIADLLNLLQLLDNPLQDLPLLGVLHSPLVGLTASELAEVRLRDRQSRFWTALMLWNQAGSNAPEMRRKVGLFLERFARWRRLARRVTLSRCLEIILAETHYPAWLLTQPNGAQRHANLQRLVALAQDFDQFQRQGLFRFLRFVEAQKDSGGEPEIPSITTENAVRLMSIHQSKGLEFPVVVLADLGKPFNLIDLRGDIIVDEEYGLCPQIKPPHTGKRYPSLPYWLARQRQLRELLGEELRLLYVAMTRARDALILTGTVPAKKIATHWRSAAQADLSQLIAARSYSDWLALWFSQHLAPDAKDKTQGKTSVLRWFIHQPASVRLAENPAIPNKKQESTIDFCDDSDVRRALVQRLSWQYPYVAATQQPAKTSVSALRRGLPADTDDQEVAPLPGDAYEAGRLLHIQRVQPAGSEANLSPAEIGTAHHEFLRMVALERTIDVDSLRREARRLLEEGRLSAAQVGVLDFHGLSRFWSSELGRRIRAQQGFVHRELGFTARFFPSELPSIFAQVANGDSTAEFILVQGVADLVIIERDQICLVDFKTDQVAEAELAMRVKMYQSQLKLYALALSRIYKCPVSESWLYFLGLRRQVCVESVATRTSSMSSLG